MKVQDILYSQGVLGQRVIKFIKENKYIDVPHQTHMLKILIDYTLANGYNLYVCCYSLSFLNSFKNFKHINF